jgi:hypothetical protein
VHCSVFSVFFLKDAKLSHKQLKSKRHEFQIAGPEIANALEENANLCTGLSSSQTNGLSAEWSDGW